MISQDAEHKARMEWREVEFKAKVAAMPYKTGEAVEILANGKRAIVHKKNLQYVSVSYVDDAGRMSTADLMYLELGPWRKAK